MARAQELLQRAIALDPDYAHAHALLGWVYVTMFNLDTRRPIGEFTDKALAAGTRAVTLDDEEPWGYLVVGLGSCAAARSKLAFASHEIGGAQSELCARPRRAWIRVSSRRPTGPRVAGSRAGTQTQSARSVSGELCAGRAVHGTVRLKRYEETVAVCRATAASHPNHAGAWRLMTVSLGLLGRIDEAREALAHTLTLQPDLSAPMSQTIRCTPTRRIARASSKGSGKPA